MECFSFTVRCDKSMGIAGNRVLPAKGESRSNASSQRRMAVLNTASRLEAGGFLGLPVKVRSCR